MDVRCRILIPVLLAFAAPASGQMVTNGTMTPAQLVENVLLGQGVSVSNISYNGVPSPSTWQEGSGSFTAVPGSFDITEGVVLSTCFISSIPGNEGGIPVGDNTGTGSDPDLLSIITELNPAWPESYDKAVLEFDFVPTGDTVKFNYIFASEEYPTFNCSPQFNDVFGFFISGPGISGPFTNNAMNIALVPGTNLPVSIANIHGADLSGCPAANSQYYVSNTGGTTVVFGGYTTVLTAVAAVTCGETYHIKLAICDAGDPTHDSAVFLQAGSFTSTGQVVPSLTADGAGLAFNDTTLFEGCGTIPFNFYRMGDTSVVDTIHLVVGGTATPGVDYYPPFPSQIIFGAGDTMLTFPLTVPYDDDDLETIVIQIQQNIQCSGITVVDEYTFYIDQYPDLEVTTTDVDALCGQTYTIGPEVTGGVGLYRYLWSTGDTTATIDVQVDTTTVFHVTVMDTCSVPAVMDSITVIIPQYDPLTITVDPDIAIPCLGNANIQATADGGNGIYSYRWTLNGATVGTNPILNVPASAPPVWYVATVEEGCGHSVSDSVQVSTEVLPDIEIMAWDTTVFCIGDSVVLFPLGVTGGNGVYTYRWLNEAGDVLSFADTLLVSVPFDAAYTLHVEDQCGYVADTAFITYYPRYLPLHIDLTPDSTICVGDSITLQAQVRGGSGVYTIDWEGWEWSDPKMLYDGDEDEVFVVDAVDQCGEFATASTRVTVQHPRVDILIYPQGVDDWLFQASTYPYYMPVLIWDLGDGTLPKSPAVTHSYLDLEDHWVTLYGVSREGCKAMDSLLVKPPATLFFPNAFTPDGDQVNDTFGPVYSSVYEFHIVIFDRWGHLVYESSDINEHWDGRDLGGGEAPTGVYVYKYRAKGHYFEANEKYGHVTLLRGSKNR